MRQFLAFEVGGRRLGLSAEILREVVRAVAVAPLPNAPAMVEGVINVRGTVVAMLDIRRRLGLPPNPLAPEQHLVLAQAAGRLVALRVDRALDLLTVPDDVIESAQQVAPGLELLAGIAKLPDGLLVIHDLDRFLSTDEAIELDAVLAQTKPAGEC